MKVDLVNFYKNSETEMSMALVDISESEEKERVSTAWDNAIWMNSQMLMFLEELKERRLEGEVIIDELLDVLCLNKED